ncbi:DEAD/DEAH box helicase [Bradyrhizobium sp. HKCCYLRH3099]|uniref:DEAD/DEAH box helicase n=1 Tax=unclassified Bradyrhizobium TaxID=2631580 RepID=UPI003EBEABCF
MADLRKFRFWTRESGDEPHLWEHQRTAVSLACAYLVCDPHIPDRPALREAALLKLPTGTGKSGIVAVLSRCVPNVRCVLILVPREALRDQLSDDLQWRFWQHIGYRTTENSTFLGDPGEIGRPLDPAYISDLLPSTIRQIDTHLPGQDRVVLIGTHQAFDQIRRTKRHSDPDVAAEAAQFLANLASRVDLVIVDEGHYEPAISWSKGVRDLNKPTILLSATPYRNDYKSFRVRGRFVFNYPHEKATATKVIRPIDFIGAPSNSKSALTAFLRLLDEKLRPVLTNAGRWTKTPKVIVRAETLDQLLKLQDKIDTTFNTSSVVVHEEAKPLRKGLKGAAKNDYRGTKVSVMRKRHPNAQFWLHQSKLIEGVDDPDFVAIAIFDLMGNDRQIIQQIGRVIRWKQRAGKSPQTGTVLALDANADRLRRTWKRYLSFEGYCASNVGHIVSNEVALPDRVLEIMPDYQYISGAFRERLALTRPLSAEDIQLPLSGAVFEKVDPVDPWDAKEIIEDAILDEDRFRVTPIVGLPNNAIGFSYYGWRNSPFLVDQFFSEWTLGVFILVDCGRLTIIHDTGRIVVDPAKLGLGRGSRQLLERAFPAGADPSSVRLTRMSFSSLDMSEHSIRSMATRTRSFATTFTDLLDPSLVPITAFGFVSRRARYIGFAKSRIRDAAERYRPLGAYLKWAEGVATELSDTGRVRSSVFDRYAQVAGPLTSKDAQPRSILLNFSEDAFADRASDTEDARATGVDQELEYEDLCAEIDDDGNFTVVVGGTKIDCNIEYREASGRYLLRSEDLNALDEPLPISDRRNTVPLTQRINQAQSFRIIPARADLVYSEGKFYRPRIDLKLPDGSLPVLEDVFAVPRLEEAISEKGQKTGPIQFTNHSVWQRQTVFGVVEAICNAAANGAPVRVWGELGKRLKSYSIVLCDDDNEETCDFIAANPAEKRIVFIHAKAGGDGTANYNVGALEVVGRQALASLAFLTRANVPPSWTASRWRADVRANDRVLAGRGRVFLNADGLSVDELNEAIKQASLNNSFEREVWIVAGNMVRRSSLEKAITDDPDGRRLRQFLMHLDALKTGCARANVRLRLFCH